MIVTIGAVGGTNVERLNSIYFFRYYVYKTDEIMLLHHHY
jgi:hypothetical protein